MIREIETGEREYKVRSARSSTLGGFLVLSGLKLFLEGQCRRDRYEQNHWLARSA